MTEIFNAFERAEVPAITEGALRTPYFAVEYRVKEWSETRGVADEAAAA